MANFDQKLVPLFLTSNFKLFFRNENVKQNQYNQSNWLRLNVIKIKICWKNMFLVHLADFITNFQKCLRFHWNIKLGLNFKKISLDREFMQHQSYSGNNILQNTSKLNAIWKNNHIYLLYTNILEPLVRWSKNVKIIAIYDKKLLTDL